MIEIIDSHVHFWNPQHLSYPWLAEVNKLNRTYMPADLPREGSSWSMAGLVFVQADCIPEHGIEEASWVASLAQEDARIKGIVAFAPLENGDAARAELEQLKANPLVKGIRRLIQSESRGFSLQPSFVEGVKSLADYDFTFDICIYHTQLPDVIQLIKQCPQIEFVLDHLGKPGIKDGTMDPWREHIVTLASFSNVRCKISGMVTEADHANWTVDHLRPYVDHLLEAFGAERLMFGSDWPVVNLAGDYHRWLSALNTLLHELSESEKKALYADNAIRFYGIDRDVL
ncbi:MAG: amidohydrolase family protein [Chloroflexi bacterium]|nr:amidohydrolase family protein [Chloroflexota bacterium]